MACAAIRPRGPPYETTLASIFGTNDDQPACGNKGILNLARLIAHHDWSRGGHDRAEKMTD